MSATYASNGLATLAPLAGSSLAKKALLVFGGSVFLAAMSQAAIGFPVPMTLQTLGVMLIGLTFGFRLATATVALYLLEGVLGIPVFAKFSSGWAAIAGGTGGYLVGFLASVAVMGLMADRGLTKGWAGTIVAVVVGTVITFSLGVAWLTYLYGFEKAMEWGVLPFVISEPIKMALAVLIGTGVLKGASRFAKL